MAYTLPARIAAHQALLELLSDGASGTAVIRLLDGETILADLPIDHEASSVNAVTGVLTLAPADGALWEESGTVDLAMLIARDETVLENGIPVESGFVASPGKVVLSSLTAISGGQVDLISAQVG